MRFRLSDVPHGHLQKRISILSVHNPLTFKIRLKSNWFFPSITIRTSKVVPSRSKRQFRNCPNLYRPKITLYPDIGFSARENGEKRTKNKRTKTCERSPTKFESEWVGMERQMITSLERTSLASLCWVIFTADKRGRTEIARHTSQIALGLWRRKMAMTQISAKKMALPLSARKYLWKLRRMLITTLPLSLVVHLDDFRWWKC